MHCALCVDETTILKGKTRMQASPQNLNPAIPTASPRTNQQILPTQLKYETRPRVHAHTVDKGEPNGQSESRLQPFQEGKALSVYLYLSQQELLKAKPYEKVYARAKLRVPNQRQSNNDVVGQLDNWFSPQITGLGFDAFVHLSNLRETA
ncbi:hypothetical protein F2Q69_00037800 [Brassica cretica]|uniref:Uncharacterized protein n=1 Tax=Brassica cretica TaxID=69181 RepID=A0A8S9SJK0_BRACR|nr:hypothetical protein F2Q69_00037800 [Brassica cretica]